MDVCQNEDIRFKHCKYTQRIYRLFLRYRILKNKKPKQTFFLLFLFLYKFPKSYLRNKYKIECNDNHVVIIHTFQSWRFFFHVLRSTNILSFQYTGLGLVDFSNIIFSLFILTTSIVRWMVFCLFNTIPIFEIISIWC